MTLPTQAEAMELIQQGRAEEALDVARIATDLEPARYDWWYCAGQALRALDRFDEAVVHLREAARLSDWHPSVCLALGISLQLAREYQEAKHVFARALDRDPDYVIAYNSLALTQKRLGEFDKAEHNLEAGLMALARLYVKGLSNDRRAARMPAVDVPGKRWIDVALHAGLYWAAGSDVEGVAWPTEQSAAEEEQTRTHEGLYYVDVPDGEGKPVRLFLPNFFNTCQHWLASTAHFSTIVGNLGTILALRGQQEEAEACFQEAAAFATGRQSGE